MLREFGGEEALLTMPQMPANAPSVPAGAASPPPLPSEATAGQRPGAPEKITLEKRGEKRSIRLEKSPAAGSSRIHVNLNWDKATSGGFLFFKPKPVDLDLGCLFKMKDGGGGVIQALGGQFGRRDSPPYMYLDKDDRSGAASEGENLYILRPELIDSVLVFAFIYEGTANFSTVNGRLKLIDTVGNETTIYLNAPDPRLTFCAICLIRSSATGVEITKEERYFPSHLEADRAFGFGFNWRAGSK